MSNKFSIKDITFLIPVRIDSIIRLENILMVVDYLESNFETNIHVLEAASYNNKILERALNNEVSFTFINDYDPVFHRTKYINYLVQMCSTPYLAIWDADVIVYPEQVRISVNRLREENINFILPYNDDFLDTTSIIRELYLKKRDMNVLKKNRSKMKPLYENPIGGGFFAKKEAYIQSGIENINFYGWGPEDADRINRWRILEYPFQRIDGPMFHFTHERGLNSNFHSEEQRYIKIMELRRLHSMSKHELKEEVESWKNSN